MARPFDATLKQLLDAFAADWLTLFAPRLGLPPTVAADPVDVDLSTVQLAADKVFRLRPPADGLVHIEPQASWDGDLPDRLLEYNVLLHRRYGGPVYSVAVLLRPEANAASLTGTLARHAAGGREYLRFGYEVVRVWELPAEPLMAGGLGATPLALLTNEARGRLGELVDRIDGRLIAENAPEATRQLVLTCGFILLGLRYNDADIAAAFVRARGMKESTTYQAILREGRQEGRIDTARKAVLTILSARFENVPPEVEERVRAATDPDRLEAAIGEAVRVPSPADLQL